ncbi:MAG TPA: hypothetical protein VFM10_09970 [Terriglobales bacterium]|jgi:hypothetical protein|nr:hypothetical protein [Terriglobales bacterium]
MNFKLTTAIATLALAIPAATAQTATTTTPTTTPNQKALTIHQRRDLQQKRIGEGVENGSLTAGEAARIERQETKLNREVKDMRQENGGKLTPQDRRIVNRQQNRLSRGIYNQKHDAQVQRPANNEVNGRQRMQQKRIGEGIENGSLTAGEAARMERREAGVNREVRGMRQANGGMLTPGEKAKVNRQQDRLSRQIYNQKHNRRVQ